MSASPERSGRMRALSPREGQVVSTHIRESSMRSGVRVAQGAGAWSVYFEATGRLWVHNDTVRKQAFQELYFYSRRSKVGTLTCSHPVKLWDEQRHLSPRETARVQGFPDHMVLPRTNHNRLFGNAVSVGCAAHALSRVVSPNEAVRHVDLCAGLGGFSFALASITDRAATVGFSEVISTAIECYQENFPCVPALGDARTATWPECDLITAGFPCQPFSVSNSKRRRDGHTNRDFYQTVLRAISVSRATRVVLENVSSFQTVGKEKFDLIVETLRSDGFHVSCEVLNSRDAGVPQERKRLYIVASKLGQPRPWDRPRVASPGVTLGDILETHTPRGAPGEGGALLTRRTLLCRQSLPPSLPPPPSAHRPVCPPPNEPNKPNKPNQQTPHT